MRIEAYRTFITVIKWNSCGEMKSDKCFIRFSSIAWYVPALRLIHSPVRTQIISSTYIRFLIPLMHRNFQLFQFISMEGLRKLCLRFINKYNKKILWGTFANKKVYRSLEINIENSFYFIKIQLYIILNIKANANFVLYYR